MTNNFPLFRLPYVALREVFSHVGAEVILPLSLCSKRSKHLVKHCQGPRKDIRIVLNASKKCLEVNNNSFVSVAAKSIFPMNLETVNIGSYVVPVKMERNILKTYWTDKKEGLKEVIKHTSDVFSRDLYSIETWGAVSSAHVRDWLEWIKTRQTKLRELYLCNEVDDDLLMYILGSDIVTGDLVLYSQCSPGFRGPSPRPYSIDHLYLNSSSWVTLDHFLAMDIKQIFLRDSHLTSQDVNIFLKKWIKGECSKRIKEVCLGISGRTEFDALFNDIGVTRREPNSIRSYVGYKGSEQIVGGFDVRRKGDGTMATIMAEHGALKIMFWPDNKGNPYH